MSDTLMSLAKSLHSYPPNAEAGISVTVEVSKLLLLASSSAISDERSIAICLTLFSVGKTSTVSSVVLISFLLPSSSTTCKFPFFDSSNSSSGDELSETSTCPGILVVNVSTCISSSPLGDDESPNTLCSSTTASFSSRISTSVSPAVLSVTFSPNKSLSSSHTILSLICLASLLSLSIADSSFSVSGETSTSSVLLAVFTSETDPSAFSVQIASVELISLSALALTLHFLLTLQLTLRGAGVSALIVIMSLITQISASPVLLQRLLLLSRQ
ncbi:uncharacterized protein [Penaeus vannamei]|uniref:uncharacterized protein n=1 Tax=Penaeus vannamei TaxID=6689 RepID=UPI00387F65ED